jgi:hypothetical protein
LDAGGFDPDDGAGGGGGFVSDEGEGGFMPDDGGEEGGFMAEDDETEQRPVADSTESGEPRRIPLRKLPAILSSLNLPCDEDVLAVFRASASGWTEPSRYATKEEEEENRMLGGGVELKDFRAVCAALMGPDDQSGDDDDGASEEGDVYKGGDESSLSEVTEDEYEEPTATANATTKKGKGGGRGKKRVELEDNGKIKLNARQREVVNDLWGMLKPEAEQQKRGGHVLGRDEVRRKVRDLGEMWTEDEVSSCQLFT